MPPREIDRLSAEIAVQNDVEIREIIAGLGSIAFDPEDEKVRNSDRLRALELVVSAQNVRCPFLVEVAICTVNGCALES